MRSYWVELFVLGTAAPFFWLLVWAFKTLPAERWQFIASVPMSKNEDGHWTGLNLTYYGVLTAFGYMVATAMIVVMAGSVSIPVPVLIVLVGGLLVAIVPSSRWIATLVEGKPCTFTVCGAVFAAVLACPLAVMSTNHALSLWGATPLPVLPLLAAMAIGYVFGEGVGRIACISFGCCYGKPITRVEGWVNQTFPRLHFVFHGSTKKIAYESQLEGVPVIPVQAMTATLHMAVAFFSFWLFLRGWFSTSIVVAMVVTQLWRVFSETLRADHRGGSRFSLYQLMALASATLSVVYALAFRQTGLTPPELTKGLEILWSPGILISLQLLGLVIFLYTGRSEVTLSRLHIDVRHERV